MLRIGEVFWWVNASEDERQDSGWHWSQFFDEAGPARFERGGPEWIRSSASHVRIREMCAGDFVIAYQAGEGVVGFTRLAKRRLRRWKRTNYSVRPRWAERLPLENPVPFSVLRQVPRSAAEIEAIKQPAGTVFRVSPLGLRSSGSARAFNPYQASAIRQFVASRVVA